MKALFRLGALASALSLLTGCAALLHPREVEQLQLVQTIGFDGTVGGMTVSVSSGAAFSEEVSAHLAAQGASIHTAVQRLQDFSLREELCFAHIRYAVVGETTACAGIAPILDYFERGTQTQLSVPLFVVRGGGAYELVALSASGESEITAALSSLEADTERQGSAHCFTVLEIASRLHRSGAALACAVTPTAPEGSVPASDGEPLALETGYAVLRGDALCAFLDTDAALGADLLLGYAPQASYVLSDGDGGTVTVQLHAAKPSFSLAPDGTLRAAVRCRAAVTESSGADAADAALLSRLEEELSRAVAAQLEAALAAETRLGADFLELWRVMPETWEGPAALRYTVAAESVLERSYDIYGSVHGEEKPHG